MNQNLGYLKNYFWFLEHMVTINGRQCYAKLLDKRDDFPYLIAHMPKVDINMLNKVVWLVI